MVPDDFTYKPTYIGSNDKLVMIGFEVLRSDARMEKLIVGTFRKSNRKGLDRPSSQFRHKAYDRARIDPPGKVLPPPSA